MIYLLWAIIGLSTKYELLCDNNSVTIVSQRLELHDYVPLKDVAEVLKINYVFDNTSQRLYLTDKEHRIVLIPDIATFLCNSTYLNLPFPARFLDNQVFFPVKAIIPVFGQAFNRLIFLKELKEVPVIEKISLVRRADSTVLKFNWQQPISFDVQLLPGRIIVEIDGQYQRKDKIKPVAEIKSVKLLAYHTYTRLELEIGEINSYQERQDEIVFYKKVTEKIEVIVIDPGHGGIDPGAVAKGGLYEKDVALDISRILKRLLEDSLKINVLLTRDRDIYMSLKSRTDYANQQHANLFISIHCNASGRSHSARGFETYFLSEARTDEERAAAAMENAALQFDEIEPADDISFIFYDLAQTAFLEESNRLAEHIQTSAEKHLAIPSRGVRQAGFYVLQGAFMPAVLVEAGFISNPSEERLLRTKEFRHTLAYCIFLGVKKYIAEYEERANK